MFKSAIRHAPLICTIIVSLGFVAFALAQETTISAEANVTAKPVRPLDLIRARFGEVKQNAVDAKAQLRANTQVKLQEADTPEERRAVLQGAVDARVDIARDRTAATSNVIRKVRDAVRQHAGLIKERFSLAMRQFDKLVARIESRIEKMKAQGIATASVEAELETAKTANAEAKADVQAVADFIASVNDSSDRAQVRTQLKTLIDEAQTSIREAHQALQKTVRSLVALTKKNRPNANASASVEAEAGVEATNE